MVKRIKGGTKIVRGQITTNTTKKVQLFDGKFTTGFKVVRFEVFENFPTTGKTMVGKLSTQRKTNYGYWQWGDDEEIAWAANNNPINSRWGDFTLVDPENMIIEDLWINAYSDGESIAMNYFIELEKYEFTSWDGAAQMVKNQSQAGPPA
jgi:hypothetical protein